MDLSRWLIETVDQLDDAYFAVTVPDREHLSWATSNYYDSWVRRLQRNDFLGHALRLAAPVMTANLEHRVVCAGGTTQLDIEQQYAALDASDNDPTSLRDLLQDWGQAAMQPSPDAPTVEQATDIRTRIASYLILADERGYVELINDTIDTLDGHDDKFRSRTNFAADISDEDVVHGLVAWWSRRISTPFV